MSNASDELREFGDMIDAGEGSKIKEPEPEAWVKQAAYERTIRTLHGDDPSAPRCTCEAPFGPDGVHLAFCDLEISKPTGPLTPGQVMCVSCQENERSRAAGIDGLCVFCRSSGDARLGHQFHFSVMIQGSHRGADGLYHDTEAPVEYEPFTLTVRAWNLAAACRKAAATPLAGWKLDGEEQS